MALLSVAMAFSPKKILAIAALMTLAVVSVDAEQIESFHAEKFLSAKDLVDEKMV